MKLTKKQIEINKQEMELDEYMERQREVYENMNKEIEDWDEKREIIRLALNEHVEILYS